MRRRETIADPRIKALIMRAVERTRYPATTPQRFYDEIAENIAGDLLGVFVGFSDPPARIIEFDEFVAKHSGIPKAVAIVCLPNSQTMWAPVVNLAYSESRELSLLIGVRIREWVALHGYDRILGMNLYHNDETFCRTFRHVGEAAVVGSVVEVRL